MEKQQLDNKIFLYNVISLGMLAGVIVLTLNWNLNPKKVPTSKLDKTVAILGISGLVFGARCAERKITRLEMLAYSAKSKKEILDLPSLKSPHPEMLLKDAPISFSEFKALIKAKQGGMNQADTIKKIWGIPKKGNSPKWRAKQKLYNWFIENYWKKP